MEAISREELLQRFSQHLEDIGGKAVVSDKDIQAQIKRYQDPLKPEELRCLLSLWASLIVYRSRVNSAERPRNREQTHAMEIAKSLCALGEFEYCKYLMDYLSEYAQPYLWAFIALEQAKRGLLEDAFKSVEKIDKNSDACRSHFLPQIALEFWRHQNPRAKQLFDEAYTAAKAYDTHIIMPNPPHAQPLPHVYSRLAIALAETGNYKFAMRVCRDIIKLSIRAQTLAKMHAFFKEKQPKLAEKIFKEIEELTKAKSSEYESMYSHWQSEVIVDFALIQSDSMIKLKLLQDAIVHAQKHKFSARDSYWRIAQAYAEIGDGVSAMLVIDKIDDYWKAQATADIAEIIAKLDLELSNGLFKKANQLARERDHVSSEAQAYKAIAINLAELGRYDEALAAIDKMYYLDSDKQEPIRLIGTKLASEGYLARALSIEFSLEFDWHFFSDLCEYSQAIEKIEVGTWLMILRDCLKIHSWIDPIWLGFLRRISV